MYNNPEMLDDADISDVIVDEQSYIPIVNHFKYLGRFISRVVTDDRYTDVRILKLEMLFGRFESRYLDLNMCMIVLKDLFTSHSFYLFY